MLDQDPQSLSDQLTAARVMRQRLIAVLETTNEPGQLPSLFADIAALDQWIALMDSEARPQEQA